MVQKWKITIPEFTGSQERSAYVYLPDSYEDSPETHYPVLYMFDGHNVFFDADATYGKSWGMKEYLDRTETQMIVAAVECNHSPDHGRLKEYAPFSFRDTQCGSITGMGHITMEWLVHTFKPEIDRKFRTMPDRLHTFIGGSSMGGLMSIYAVTQYNHVFSGGLISVYLDRPGKAGTDDPESEDPSGYGNLPGLWLKRDGRASGGQKKSGDNSRGAPGEKSSSDRTHYSGRDSL